MASNTFYEMHTRTHTPRLGVLQHVNLQIAHQFQYVPDPASPQRCQLARPRLPAMTCENAVPNQQGQSFKGKQGNCRQIAHMSLTVNSAMRVPNLASTPRLDLRHSFGKMGRAGHRALLSETRQPWPQTRSMKCTRTHAPRLGVLQHVNLQIAHQFQYVPDPAAPQRCQLARPRLPAMACENAVPNQQGQSFKGKQGKSKQITHVNLNVNSATRVPNLALRTWTCGTAAATSARASSMWVRSQLQV